MLDTVLFLRLGVRTDPGAAKRAFGDRDYRFSFCLQLMWVLADVCGLFANNVGSWQLLVITAGLGIKLIWMILKPFSDQ